MAQMVKILIKSGTRAALDAAKAASQLNARELYFIEDEQKLAVGTAANNYKDIGGGLQYWTETAATSNRGEILETKDTANGNRGLVIKTRQSTRYADRSNGAILISGTGTGRALDTSNYAVIIGGASGAISNSVYGAVLISEGSSLSSSNYSGILAGLNHLIYGGTHSSIIAGLNHTVTGTGLNKANVIFGGENNKIDTSNGSAILCGNYHQIGLSEKTTIQAGSYNLTEKAEAASISGGSYNRISASTNSAILGGERNLVGGNNAGVLGGRFNEARGEGATTIGGRDNSALASGSTALGIGARAIRPGQIAYASKQELLGTKLWTGSGQGSFYTMSAHTIGAQTLQMSLGESYSLFNLEDRNLIQFDLQLTAFSTDFEVATYRRIFTIKRGAGPETTALVGTVQTVGTDTVEAALSGIEISITADTTRGGLSFTVAGISAKELQWQATLRTVETKI